MIFMILVKHTDGTIVCHLAKRDHFDIVTDRFDHGDIFGRSILPSTTLDDLHIDYNFVLWGSYLTKLGNRAYVYKLRKI